MGYAVRRARQRLVTGFYDRPEVVSLAFDRLIDEAQRQFGRQS